MQGKRKDTKRALVTLPRRRFDRRLRELRWHVKAYNANQLLQGVGSRPSRTSPRSPDRAREVADRQEVQDRRAQHLRAGDRTPSRRRSQAAYRVIDFRRDKDGIPARVATIEYDPNRNARIALLNYPMARSATSWPRSGSTSTTCSSPGKADIRPGNALPLRYIPAGYRPQRRAAARRRRQDGPRRRHGRAARGQRGRFRHPAAALDRDAPGSIDCRATLGVVGNAEAELIKLGKAGRNRWKGIRPQTRGVAMNPVDHPLGGGEGKSSGGRHPVALGQARGAHPGAARSQSM